MNYVPLVSYMAIPGVKLERADVTPELIIKTVCEYFKVSRKDIFRKCRQREFVFPRQVAMFLIRCINIPIQPTLEEVGSSFGHKYDHTTVMHSISTVNDLMEGSAEIRNNIGKLYFNIFGRNLNKVTKPVHISKPRILKIPVIVPDVKFKRPEAVYLNRQW